MQGKELSPILVGIASGDIFVGELEKEVAVYNRFS
jgi:hypothetical protein